MWIVVIIFLALVIPIVIAHGKERYESYKNHSTGVMNHDASFRQFIYKTDKSGNEICAV